MNYTTLPGTDVKISEICLGTMTFGQQNSEADGHSQIDFALDKGINFIDTAEMYSVPSREKTSGSTEKIIGTWLKKSGRRDEVVLATKIAGPNRGLEYIREDLTFNNTTIRLSVEKSLQRLQTDYIDLYQLHWPERNVNFFGQRGFKVKEETWEDNIQQVLETIQALIKEGKIKHFGLSNETPWGLMRFLEESRKHNLPKIATVQNPYSLLNRSFEVGNAEVCCRENVGLLAYSPLAFGVLSGKFLADENHPNARINLFPNFSRYNSENSRRASVLYNEIAKKNDLSLTEMALAFIRQQEFVSATIIGATTLEQLEENINTTSVFLSEEILKEIEKVQNLIPDPAP
ncbi:aryl-alcohol dehydrogenase-like predicted oxidoreductase [Flavobacterium arsenatis]|uniref:Aryl-alcohol dehydrogenase-like predicted oxidoreductase n=1 Tax=Flavobacterium arsenatis TaxID=1484332 RepID=A0ABU1TL82_9FLAO|nr:NADP(H)-dependent aldo-keto reductase [Flavobacterium arsenatis]MDR6966711.1 aryl-alcohol dehydrogenase-like predicted oxidoreductase [Flavobacterium arsenatis]